MFVFPNVRDVVKKWKPKKINSKELEYRDDLLKYIRKQLSPKDMFSKEYIIKKESSRAYVDIAVHDGDPRDGVGIELKYNLKTKSQTDRLYGQVEGYLREYHGVIIVLCGESNPEQVQYLKEKIRSISQLFKSIEIIQK